jgi:hypothetical protein
MASMHVMTNELGAARFGVLLDQLAVARGRFDDPLTEAEADLALDAIEATTAEIAETPAPFLEGCRQKAALLRERLLETLDTAVPSEAVTLSLAASLVLDLARLEL